jgi:hypothetical protein
MRRGQELEPVARNLYEIQTGNLVITTGAWGLDELPFILASPDGLIGDDGLWEGKCPRTCPIVMPLRHQIQCRVQMGITGRKWVDYYAYAEDGVHLERVTHDERKWQQILQGLREFWSLIEADIEPPRGKKFQFKE